MKEDILKTINFYGVLPQLKYFQSEIYELNEAILEHEKVDYYKEATREHIAEEIADVLYMLKQFQYYYGFNDEKIESLMEYKVNRQLKRIENESND